LFIGKQLFEFNLEILWRNDFTLVNSRGIKVTKYNKINLDALIGKKLFVGKEVYDNLNEIIDKYINPCN